MPDITEYLTLAEASKETGLSHGALKLAIHRLQLVATRQGYTWFVLPADLDDYMEYRDSRKGGARTVPSDS